MRGLALPGHFLALLLLLAGCAEAGDDAAFCADAPLSTWENHGAGYVVENCRACHHPEAADRQGAPVGVDFVTEDAVLARREQVLAVATGASPTMPPGGGTDGDARYRFEVWLRCDAP